MQKKIIPMSKIFLVLFLFCTIVLSLNASNKGTTIPNGNSNNKAMEIQMIDTLVTKDNCLIRAISTSQTTFSNQNDQTQDKTKTENEDNSLLITVIFPIITLILGVLLDKLIDKYSYRKKIIKAGKRWIAEIQSLDPSFDLQINSLTRYKEELKDEEFNIPKPQLYSSLNGEVFKSLDKNELVEYIGIKNKKIEEGKHILISTHTNGYISQLTSIYDDIYKKFNTFVSQNSNWTSSLSLNIQKFNNAFSHFSVELESRMGDREVLEDPIFTPLANLYLQHFAPHLNDGEYNPFKLEVDFFIPMMKYMADNYKKEKIAIPLTDAMTGCLIDIKALRMERRYIKENIDQTIGFYRKLKEELPEIVSNISKYKVSIK